MTEPSNTHCLRPPVPLFRHCERNLVLFAYTREVDEDPPQEIMVLQQARKRHNKLSEEDRVAQMFGSLNLEGTTQQLFLSKVDPLEHRELAQEIKEMMGVADSFSRKERLDRRKQMFESSRAEKMSSQVAPEDVLAKRRIRVVRMDSLAQGGGIKGVVDLGGMPIQYEDLGLSQRQEYYTLVRKAVRADQVFPQVSIEEHLLSAIDFEEEQPEKEKQQDDDFDSNDSENSAFDYPEEEGSDRSSEGIIREYDSEEGEGERQGEDQEELYLRYLRRERRRDQEMDEEYRYEEYD